ncbi:MAG: TIGR04282 family arsenosugar biosynthesis glycosyltransferase [Candidatus Binatia bacterium]
MTTASNGYQQRHSALVVAAKAALVGEVKTRLCPPLTLPQACRLYECLLEDIVAKMAKYDEAELWIAFAPEREDYFRRNFAQRRKLLSQRGSDLGERLHHIFVDLFYLGYKEVIVTDSDSPTVPLSSIAQGFQLLHTDGNDVVLGPSRDGGYYLIGLKSPTEGLFTQIPWSSVAVLEKTLKRASMLGLKVALLPPSYDIDVEGDLRQLWGDLQASLDLQESAHRTYTFLREFFTDPGLELREHAPLPLRDDNKRA